MSAPACPSRAALHLVAPHQEEQIWYEIYMALLLARRGFSMVIKRRSMAGRRSERWSQWSEALRLAGTQSLSVLCVLEAGRRAREKSLVLKGQGKVLEDFGDHILCHRFAQNLIKFIGGSIL